MPSRPTSGAISPDEPVVAAAPSVLYRFRKFARRNKAALALVAAIALVLVAATAVSSWQALVAHEARQSSDAAQKKEEAARLEEQRARVEADRLKAEAIEGEKAMEAERNVAQRESYRSSVRLAEAMLQGDEQARYRAADVLWETPPELRGWEWGHLMAQCPLEEWSIQIGQGQLEALDATPDGRLMATAGSDGTVALWDLASRRELWRTKTESVRTIDFDPRGRFLAVSGRGDWTPCFTILDLADGCCRKALGEE